MRPLRPAALLAVSVILAAAARGDAPPPAAEPTGSGSASYVAPSQALTSLKGLQDFVLEAADAGWDPDRAARVENLTFEKDAAKWTMTGWILLRKQVDGITYRASFFGDGRFELVPPIRMEVEQVKRFLGTPSVDVKFKTSRFTFTGADDQAFFEKLTYTAEAAAKCEAENDDCKSQVKAIRERLEKGETEEAVSRRRFSELTTAATAYERFLDPHFEGGFTSEMKVDVPETTDKSRPYLVNLTFDYDPDSLEEVALAGTWDHGKSQPQSLITRFHAKGQYDATSNRTASSAFAETETKSDFAVRTNTFRIKLDPGTKREMVMKADMDCLILGDAVRFLVFYVTGALAVTKATVDGGPAEYMQPEVPGTDRHANFVLVTVPRVLKKNDELKVSLELEGRILVNINSGTWRVAEEDNWFPAAPGDTAGIAPRFVTTLLTPKGFTAIANGKQSACDPSEAEADMECTKFTTNTGIDFATFNIGRDFRVDKGESLDEDADRDGKIDPKVPIRVYTNATAKNNFEYVDPDNPILVQRRSYSLSENGPDAVGRAQIAHKVYTEWFGPCPYDTLMITPHPKGHGRGSASLLLISQDAFLSSTANAEWASLTKQTYRPYDLIAFLVHEIAHQWWGGAVRIRGDRDQWFSEGFADYGAALVLEELDKVNDTKWFWGKLSEFREHLLKDDGYSNGVAPLCLGNRFASAENRPGYQGVFGRQNFMYSKGAYVMHMLRMLARARAGTPEKGDALFKDAMHDFVSECVRSGRPPSNVDMERMLSKSMGMPLDWFFDQWIYGTGVPKVDWSYRVAQNADGTWAVDGRLKQKDTAFQFPLAVSFFEKDKELGFGYTWIGKQETEFHLGPLPFKPEHVDVNTEFGVLGIFKEVPWTGSAAGQ